MPHLANITATPLTTNLENLARVSHNTSMVTLCKAHGQETVIPSPPGETLADIAHKLTAEGFPPVTVADYKFETLILPGAVTYLFIAPHYTQTSIGLAGNHTVHAASPSYDDIFAGVTGVGKKMMMSRMCPEFSAAFDATAVRVIQQKGDSYQVHFRGTATSFLYFPVSTASTGLMNDIACDQKLTRVRGTSGASLTYVRAGDIDDIQHKNKQPELLMLIFSDAATNGQRLEFQSPPDAAVAERLLAADARKPSP